MLTDQEDTFVWPTEFACILLLDNQLLPNHYTIKISVEPSTPKSKNISIGFRKIKYFIKNYLQNSIIVNKDNPIIKSFDAINTNIVYLPSEPYDYYIASILLNKLSIISEQYFDINQITIDSLLGDHVQFSIRHPNECGLDLMGDHWWNRDSVSTGPNNNVSWEDLKLNDKKPFSPRVIQGGLSEN